MGRLDAVHCDDERAVEVSGAEELERVRVWVAGELVAFALQNEYLEAQVLELAATSEILSVDATL